MSKDKLSGLALWGAIVGLVGGIIGSWGGGLVLWDRFFPPEVEVLGIRPVAIFSKKQMVNTEIYAPAYGISAIVHVRAKNRKAVVGGLELSGKIYMGVNEYVSYYNLEDMRIDDIDNEVSNKKPFYVISLNAWPTNPNTAVQLEPFEERYIAFTFLEPTHLDDSKEIDKKFLGIESASILPIQKRTRPDLFDFFEGRIAKDGKSIQPFKIRDEIKNGLANFDLKVGPKAIKIEPSKLKDFCVIGQEEWEAQTPSKLFNQPSRF